MLKILEDLAQDDYFGLIIFDSKVDVWKPELVQATERNLNQAKDFVKRIMDRGGTVIFSTEHNMTQVLVSITSYMYVTSMAVIFKWIIYNI